jgi:hypothetical protein
MVMLTEIALLNPPIYEIAVRAIAGTEVLSD